MKRMIWYILALVIAISLAACSKTQEYVVEDTSIPQESELSIGNEVLKYFTEKYDMRFDLWCPDGHDLYAFYIFPDHAERRCDMLMPTNTNDVSEYDNNLSWKVDGDELIITGEWEESFKINISTGTATSTTSNKVYQIVKPQPPLE